MMGTLRILSGRLAACERGSVVIETAVVAPVLVLLAIGGFEASTIVARQTELQSAAGEAASIVRASIPETQSDRNTIRDVIATSTGLPINQVSVTEVYRCGTAASYSTDKAACGGAVTYTFIAVAMTDTYDPIWTDFGIGSAMAFTVERTVQIG